MIWFISDTHFGHAGILIHQAERMNAFECLEEMDACLIDGINRFVKRNDELWHLGDFCWQASRAGHYRQRLNVRKLNIIQGNHDSNSLKKYCSNLWESCRRKFHGHRFHLYHYPCLSWWGLHSGGIHLYGHSHGRYEQELNKIYPGRRAMDVSVDNLYHVLGEWRPICIDEVLQRFQVDAGTQRIAGPFEEGET